MKVLKKNQLIIFVISLMLITAGYLNYSSNFNNTIPTSTELNQIDIAGIGDATLVSSNNIVENEIQYENTIESSIQVANTQADYFASSRLERDKMYSQIIESYQKILENENITSEQKAIASQEIYKINNLKNTIMISENLIKMKDFKDCVIFVNDKSISVIIRADTLQTEQIAQVQNIISREMQANISNIHISNK